MNLPSTPVEIQEERRLIERFVVRARTVFYIRLAIITLSLAVLSFPTLHIVIMGHFSPWLIAATAIVGIGAVMSMLAASNCRWGRWVNFLTLNIDLIWIVFIISSTHGIMSPMMALMPVYASMFSLLFNNAFTVLPPLLVLPIVSALGVNFSSDASVPLHLLAVIYYGLLNGACVYMTSYSFAVEEAQSRKIIRLQSKLKELAISEQRAHIAREIHDGLGANVSSLGIQCEYLLTLSHLNSDVVDELKQLKSSAEDAMSELRQSVSVMRGEFDLVEQLSRYVDNYIKRHKIATAVNISGSFARVTTEEKLSIFRIIQEALTNAAKHSQATQISVELAGNERLVKLSVEDDGVGILEHHAKNNHYGLINLKERAHKIGGILSFEQNSGNGTTLAMSLTIDGRTQKKNNNSQPFA